MYVHVYSSINIINVIYIMHPHNEDAYSHTEVLKYIPNNYNGKYWCLIKIIDYHI